MHYCIAIITDQFPSDEVIQKMLAPFNEESFFKQFEDVDEIPEDKYPQFTWDWWQIGGRYCGKIKMKIDETDTEYDWGYYSKQPRAGRLYRSQIFEKHFNSLDSDGHVSFRNREEDAYPYFGYREGYIRVDGCKIKDIIDFDDTVTVCWGFIGKDGTAYSRTRWNGKDFIKDENFERKVMKATADVNDCYLCFVDVHD